MQRGHHLAAAVMIGMFAWDWALVLPDAISTFANLTAGMGLSAGRVLFTLAQVAAPMLAAGAVVGLRRASGAAALAVGGLERTGRTRGARSAGAPPGVSYFLDLRDSHPAA